MVRNCLVRIAEVCVIAVLNDERWHSVLPGGHQERSLIPGTVEGGHDEPRPATQQTPSVCELGGCPARDPEEHISRPPIESACFGESTELRSHTGPGAGS
jgi:hypothetical protein